MNDDPSRRRRLDIELGVVLGLALVLLAGTATADSTGGDQAPIGSARLTAVSGEASLGGNPADRRNDLGDQAVIATGIDGNAAMLVDEDNLVELCASTKMKLTRNPNGGRVIEVGAGTTRIIVEPGSSDEPLQISTPAAIATILGTVVYVTVDPVTGETTIASEDHPVKIESSDPNVSGSTTINGMEKLTMLPGEAPAATPQKLAKSVLENMGGCLKDIHGDAVAFDRGRMADKVSERLATADGEVAELPVVGMAPVFEPTLPDPGPPGEDTAELPGQDGPLSNAGTDVAEQESDSSDSSDYPDIPDIPDFDLPSACDGIPADGCFPFPEFDDQEP